MTGKGDPSAPTLEASITDYTAQYPPVTSAPPVYPPVPSAAAGVPVDGFPVHPQHPQGAPSPYTPPPPHPPPYTSDPNAYQPLLGPQPVQDGATIIVYSHSFQPPERVMCTRCSQAVVPEPHLASGLCTWLVAGGLCLIGCWPLACVPFCCAPTKDTLFACPQCKSELYRLKRAPL